jgi:hypothetical protein
MMEPLDLIGIHPTVRSLRRDLKDRLIDATSNLRSRLSL